MSAGIASTAFESLSSASCRAAVASASSAIAIDKMYSFSFS